MYILGINISHHASIALLKDGELIYFLEEERLSKIKYSMLISPDNVHRASTLPNIGFFNLKVLKKITNHIDEIIFSSYMVEDTSDNITIDLILNSLKNSNITYNNFTFQNQHHIYHAFSSLFQSRFKTAGCLILDGAGSFLDSKNQHLREIESIYKISEKKGIKPLFKHYSTLDNKDQNFLRKEKDKCEIIYSNSLGCGYLFNQMCSSLGFREVINEPGKLMGLSSYGKSYRYPENWYVNIEGVQISDNYIIRNFYEVSDKALNHYAEKANISKKLQEETLKHTLYLIEKTLRLSQSKNLILSGGYFLNCVNNYRYLDYIPKDINVYIDPLSNDSGTALGAAYYIWYLKNKKFNNIPFNNLYLGPQYSKKQLLEGIKKYI